MNTSRRSRLLAAILFLCFSEANASAGIELGPGFLDLGQLLAAAARVDREKAEISAGAVLSMTSEVKALLGTGDPLGRAKVDRVTAPAIKQLLAQGEAALSKAGPNSLKATFTLKPVGETRVLPAPGEKLAVRQDVECPSSNAQRPAADEIAKSWSTTLKRLGFTLPPDVSVIYSMNGGVVYSGGRPSNSCSLPMITLSLEQVESLQEKIKNGLIVYSTNEIGARSRSHTRTIQLAKDPSDNRIFIDPISPKSTDLAGK